MSDRIKALTVYLENEQVLAIVYPNLKKFGT